MDNSSDSDPTDLGKNSAGDEGYALAETHHAPRVVRLPIEVRLAMEKAEAAVSKKPPPPRRFQFTIRDLLIFTTVLAILMGVVSAIAHGMPAILIYSVFFLLMIAAWLVVGLREMGFWRKNPRREDSFDDDSSLEDDEDSEIQPETEPAAHLFQYPLLDLLMVVAGFALLMSFCELLPSEHKLSNVAGVSGFFSLLGLGWFAVSDDRHPRVILLWGLMVATYLLATFAAVVQSKERAETPALDHRTPVFAHRMSVAVEYDLRIEKCIPKLEVG